MEAEAKPEILPEGFNYYAGGHVHKPYKLPFKGGILVYSGCTETVSYEDAETEKGFYHVEVDEKGVPKLHRVKLETPRPFIVLDHDYSGLTPMKITEAVVKLVKEADEAGAVIVPIVRGVLPAESARGEIDLAKIRSAAEKALLVHPLLRLRETEVPEEVIRSIFEGGIKDLKTKAFEYFFEIFSERFPREEAEKIARLAVDLLEPLAGKQEMKVKKALEEYL
jgi:DNA repair exonuclease SbcCD nuclease subunit